MTAYSSSTGGHSPFPRALGRTYGEGRGIELPTLTYPVAQTHVEDLLELGASGALPVVSTPDVPAAILISDLKRLIHPG